MQCRGPAPKCSSYANGGNQLVLDAHTYSGPVSREDAVRIYPCLPLTEEERVGARATVSSMCHEKE